MAVRRENLPTGDWGAGVRRLRELRGAAWWTLLAALAAVYFAAAKLGLSLAFAAEQVSPVWPPTGLALAATLLLGYRVPTRPAPSRWRPPPGSPSATPSRRSPALGCCAAGASAPRSTASKTCCGWACSRPRRAPR
jgi:hypothetical protein